MAIGPDNQCRMSRAKARSYNVGSSQRCSGKVSDFLAQIADEIQCWSIHRSQVHRNGLKDVGGCENIIIIIIIIPPVVKIPGG